jgi:hypothetical protein
MRRRLLVVAAAGLFCGFSVSPDYKRESVNGPVALAVQDCWGKLNGKAQVEWHEHLRKIDEPARADSVMTSTTRSVALCVADAAASREPDPSIAPIVDAFVKHRFGIPAHGYTR